MVRSSALDVLRMAQDVVSGQEFLAMGRRATSRGGEIVQPGAE